MAIDLDENSICEFKSPIATLIEKVCLTGLEIAREFAQAEKCLSKKDFRVLHAHFSLSYSTARKLVKVGDSQRIRDHEQQLRHLGVDAWSTLHEIVKLDEQDFERFSARYLSAEEPRPFMRSDVERMKTSVAAKTGGFSLLAAVEVDAACLNDDEILSAAYEQVGAFTRNLKSLSGVRVRSTHLLSRIEAQQDALFFQDLGDR